MKAGLKKLLVFVLAAVLMITTAGGFSGSKKVFADQDMMLIAPAPTTSVKVYVTIIDGNGKIQLEQAATDVTDIDKDGVLTINDALIIAHDNNYPGGADAGYAYVDAAQYGYTGYSLSKLWGIENGGSYGVGKNSLLSDIGIADTVEDGDFVDAYCFQDLVKWSDKYSRFNNRLIEVNRKEAFKLKLTYLAYGSDYSIYEKPVKNAVIIDNGSKLDKKVNKKGVVKLSFNTIGRHVITAESTRKKTVLVTPICEVWVVPNKGNLTSVDKETGLQYKVVVPASKINDTIGEVVVYKNDNNAEVPDTIVFGGLTYKVNKE
ncbi:MAG: hypothetical protein IK071_10020 [Lachnospiraceae bacterium]|nr:hypothetical protein [Lachnospiraceae bacterium]